MIKQWKIEAEVDMDASKHVTVTTEANTERKARFIAQKRLEETYSFVKIMNVEQITNEVKDE